MTPVSGHGRRLLATIAVITVLSVACSPNGTRVSAPVSQPSSLLPQSAGAGPEPSETTAAEATLAWVPLTATGPAAREDHTWTVDGDGQLAYLFGGRDGGTAFDDLWAYDLQTDAWLELAPPALPPARFGHEAAWVDDIGLVVFAGQAGSAFFNDLWAYDAEENTWTELPAEGAVPVARYGTCSALGPDGRLWISHGFTSDGARFADTRAYDFASATWTDMTPSGDAPVERCLHTCWWTDAGDLALYAGQTTGVAALGDRWTLGDDGWTRVDGELPAERNLPAHVRLDGATLVFGGMALDLAFLDDVWLLHDGEPDAGMLTPEAPAPDPRAGATLVADAARDRVLLFGGRGADGAFGDTWALLGVDEAT